jgi:RHS repeat-associated protein
MGEGSIQILPGQYFDKETGRAYNYFRDYDPQTGRYVQSDPIGLRGGINLYLYAIDPLTQIDPMGLMGRGSGVPSRPQQPWPREMNDFGPCAYYDQKCQDTGCFYYCYSAPAVCRNAQSAPAPYSFYGPSKLNCVRRCLVREDQKIRGAACDGKRCLPDKDIDDYHQTCFTECGVPPILYPGVNPWWFFNLNPQ